MTILKFVLAGLDFIVTALMILVSCASYKQSGKGVVALMVLVGILAAASGLALMIP